MGPFQKSSIRRKDYVEACIFAYTFLYTEYITRHALKDFKVGVKTGADRVSNLRYANDITLIATSDEEIDDLWQCRKRKSKANQQNRRQKLRIRMIDLEN